MFEVNQLLQEIRAIVWDKRTVHEKPENEPSSVENTDDIPF
jgi:hypothetical protein